jgi:hypothetical protein
MMPMSGGTGSGGQGATRPRPAYLLDDSNAFVVDLPFTSPVIGAEDPGFR